MALKFVWVIFRFCHTQPDILHVADHAFSTLSCVQLIPIHAFHLNRASSCHFQPSLSAHYILRRPRCFPAFQFTARVEEHAPTMAWWTRGFCWLKPSTGSGIEDMKMKLGSIAALALAAWASGTPLAAAQTASTGKYQVIYIPLSSSIRVTDRSKPAGHALAAQPTETGIVLSASGTSTGGRAAQNHLGAFDAETSSPLGPIFRANSVCDEDASDTCIDTGLIQSTKAGNRTLVYSGYGITAGGDDASHRFLGAGYVGTPTPVKEIPKNVTATFAGSFIGQGLVLGVPSEDTATSVLTGSTSIKADFKKGTVTGVISNINDVDNYDGELTKIDQRLALTGKIKGNEYTGTASFTNAAGKAVGKTTQSALNGQFFGPKAAETAGALRVEGTVPLTSGGKQLVPGMKAPSVAFIGSYGAVKTLQSPARK